MNCKPNDLAFVKSSFVKSNIGKIVTCLYVVSPEECLTNWLDKEANPWWKVDKDLNLVNAMGDISTSDYCPDRNLKPIRDQDGEDETLSWVGLPKTDLNPVETII